MTDLASALLQGAGLGGLLLAAVSDLRTRLIPDHLVLWVLATGGAARVLTEGWSSGFSFATAFAVFVPAAYLASREVIGGGDAKMLPAALLLAPWREDLDLLLAIALAGGLLAAAALVVGARRKLGAPPPTLPYGVAILVGSAGVLLRNLT